jgi:rubredoxin
MGKRRPGERRGDPHEGFPPGTRWSAIPEDWACPDCAVREKPDFVEEADPDES